MSQSSPPSVQALEAADLVLADLSDRGGIGPALDGIDDTTKEEIRETLATIIEKAMS